MFHTHHTELDYKRSGFLREGGGGFPGARDRCTTVCVQHFFFMCFFNFVCTTFMFSTHITQGWIIREEDTWYEKEEEEEEGSLGHRAGARLCVFNRLQLETNQRGQLFLVKIAKTLYFYLCLQKCIEERQTRVGGCFETSTKRKVGEGDISLWVYIIIIYSRYTQIYLSV